MSRILIINEDNIELYLYDKTECAYKTNNICFNNNCKWLGKKCYNVCNKFKEETLTRYED